MEPTEGPVLSGARAAKTARSDVARIAPVEGGRSQTRRRSIVAAAIVFAISATNLAAQMTQEEKNMHALHGLMHVYAAGMVCYYKKWSFSRAETDEMLQKIKELSKNVPQKTKDDMWAQVQEIMGEGQASAGQGSALGLGPDIAAKNRATFAHADTARTRGAER